MKKWIPLFKVVDLKGREIMVTREQLQGLEKMRAQLERGGMHPSGGGSSLPASQKESEHYDFLYRMGFLQPVHGKLVCRSCRSDLTGRFIKSNFCPACGAALL